MVESREDGWSELGPDVERWLALGGEAPATTIRLVLTDIDGVLTGGEGATADPSVLARVAARNDAAREDPLVPAIALCTGRQAPYVELLAQLTRTFVPCLFEHGAGLMEPRRFRFLFNPALGPAPWRGIAAVREVLEAPLLAPRRAFVQPGKEASLTLYPLGSTTTTEVAQAARAALADVGSPFVVTPNINGVEIRRQGIDKGTGARWLAERLGLPLVAFGGVGDADDDLTFLRLVGFPAAPANATPAVREQVRFVASRGDGEGLLEILDRITHENCSA